MCVNLRKGQGVDMFPLTENKVDLFPQTGAYSDINKRVSCHIETVCLLSNRKADSHIKLSLDMDEYYNIIEKEQAEKK